MTKEGAEFYANQLLSYIEGKKDTENQPVIGKQFNDETIAQIVTIQLIDIIKYAAGCLETQAISKKEVERIQRIFKILHD